MINLLDHEFYYSGETDEQIAKEGFRKQEWVPALDAIKVRVRDESIGGDNPYRWETLSSRDLFLDKNVVLFSLPGAFTPTCSTMQVPGFEAIAEELKTEHGVDEVYCMSVNDSFVMNAWAKQLGLEHVKVIPDGNAEFTLDIGMLVKKANCGFGYRSWRYAAHILNGQIQKWWQEPGICDDDEDDPYGATSPETVMAYFEKLKADHEAELAANEAAAAAAAKEEQE